MTYVHEKDKWEHRWPAAVKYVEDHRLNEFFDGEANDIGIVLQGGALQHHDPRADAQRPRRRLRRQSRCRSTC